jgi:hypothetical protein
MLLSSTLATVATVAIPDTCQPSHATATRHATAVPASIKTANSGLGGKLPSTV